MCSKKAINDVLLNGDKPGGALVHIRYFISNPHETRKEIHRMKRTAGTLLDFFRIEAGL